MEHCKWNPSIEQCCGKSSSSAVSRCYLDWLKTIGFIIVWSVFSTHLTTVEIDVSPFHVLLSNIFEPLPRGPLITHAQTELRVIAALDYPFYVSDRPETPCEYSPTNRGWNIYFPQSVDEILWSKHLFNKAYSARTFTISDFVVFAPYQVCKQFLNELFFFFFSKS